MAAGANIGDVLQVADQVDQIPVIVGVIPAESGLLQDSEGLVVPGPDR